LRIGSGSAARSLSLSLFTVRAYSVKVTGRLAPPALELPAWSALLTCPLA
jgi:hypothetical protein